MFDVNDAAVIIMSITYVRNSQPKRRAGVREKLQPAYRFASGREAWIYNPGLGRVMGEIGALLAPMTDRLTPPEQKRLTALLGKLLER